ncbi:hypothetical protein Glove_194g138 [Diversispora epigaea]|uniref:Protein kinase domain-containing protein n=1 Tax=Diversispora epigaea TaxID=1348612 RepID=A0A397IQU2_9GLOM|nr:hypothetical protein Glove_194g138 [Diversispora epigaea]
MAYQIIQPSNRPNEEYKILQLLGEGGFGVCVKVEDQAGQVFAIKAIEKDALGQNQNDVLNEMKIQNQLNHQNIVKLHDVFDDDDFVYFRMELCSNQSLFEMVSNRGELTEPEVRFYMLQLLDAVEYMHNKNILHRDLKLENIFISEDMDLKVGDFGLSIELESTDQRFNYTCGTVSYMAPEVLDTQIGHSFEADVWSIDDRSTVVNQILNIGYDFPENTGVSNEAMDLIYLILNPEYDARLTIPEIRRHSFFNGATPPGLPTYALTTAPNYNIITDPEVWNDDEDADTNDDADINDDADADANADEEEEMLIESCHYFLARYVSIGKHVPLLLAVAETSWDKIGISTMAYADDGDYYDN